MEVSQTTNKLGATDTNLSHCLEALLAKALRRPVGIEHLRREPGQFVTGFPSEILHLSLHGGEELSIFLKYFDFEIANNPDRSCQEREIEIYQELLGEDNLPAVKCYGSRWNAVTRKQELFLEYLSDWRLEWQKFEHWPTAARRLAHLHAHFRTRAEKLNRCGFLLRLDDAYFRRWIDQALDVVATYDGSFVGDLMPVARSYDRVVELLVNQPLTLVHNDASPQNILVDASRNPARICIVDWEMAGIGPGLVDLAFLKYGFDPARDEVLCDAYRAGLSEVSITPPAQREFQRQLAACEMHRVVYLLAGSQSWKSPKENVVEWVAEARQLISKL